MRRCKLCGGELDQPTITGTHRKREQCVESLQMKIQIIAARVDDILNRFANELAKDGKKM